MDLRVRIEVAICDGIGISTSDRVVFREFWCPFLPVAGMNVIAGSWESGPIEKVIAEYDRGDKSWTIFCYPEEDRRRMHTSSWNNAEPKPSVEDIVSEYVEEGWHRA